jgi:hypothetical protein
VQVEPGLWRSGQPTTAEGWAYLKSLGITQVVKLNFASEGDDVGAEDIGLIVHVFSIQPEGDLDLIDNIIHTYIPPDPWMVADADAAIDAGIATGVLVHCTHGQDRTGYVIGRRRLREHWSKADAYKEMLAHHFHPELHGLHEAWERTQ